MEVYGLEEKKAIEELKSLSPSEQSIDSILNLIEKQDKIIYEMAKAIYRMDTVSEYGFNKEEIIEYFTKLVEEEN